MRASAEELVAEASGKSKAEIEVVLARWAPRPDVPERLERMERSLGADRGPHAERDRSLDTRNDNFVVDGFGE